MPKKKAGKNSGQRTLLGMNFIFAVAAIVPASFVIDQAWAADRIPTFDIVRNCNAEVASAGTETANCTKDETDAKNELAKRWPQFRVDH